MKSLKYLSCVNTKRKSRCPIKNDRNKIDKIMTRLTPHSPVIASCGGKIQGAILRISNLNFEK